MNRIDVDHLPIILMDKDCERTYSVFERADVALSDNSLLENLAVVGTRSETSWSLVYVLPRTNLAADSELRSIPLEKVTAYRQLGWKS